MPQEFLAQKARALLPILFEFARGGAMRRMDSSHERIRLLEISYVFDFLFESSRTFCLKSVFRENYIVIVDS